MNIRYKLNTTVKDDTNVASFIVFGRVARDLIYVPAQNLATAVNSAIFTLPPTIKAILGQKHIFQIFHA